MMVHSSTAAMETGSGDSPRAAKLASARVSLVERVRERLAELGCESIWARGAGSQVLLGLRGEDAYARLTPVRDSLYGLAFRTPAPPECAPSEPLSGPRRWEPLLLVDTLEDLVEHALVAIDAIPDSLEA